MVPPLLCVAAHLRRPALGSPSDVSPTDQDAAAAPATRTGVPPKGLLSALYLTRFILPSSTLSALRGSGAGPSAQRAPPEKSVVYEIMSTCSPPRSPSRCFCPTTHSKQLYKMALGFLFPHNLCMWSSIMGSSITRTAPLWIHRSFSLSVRLVATLGDSFCGFCESVLSR